MFLEKSSILSASNNQAVTGWKKFQPVFLMKIKEEKA